MPSTRTLSVAAILLLLTAIVVILVSGVVRKSRLDAEARDLAVEITQAVFTADADRLIANAHSLMLADQSPRQLGGYIDFANRQLGALQRIESIAGDTRVSLLPMGGPPATAAYVLHLQFLESAADLEIGMQQEQSQWRITQFMIQAEVMFQ
jgi:hypothetical protein